MTYKYIRWNHLLLPDFTLFNQLDQLTIYGFVPSIHRSSELRVGQFNRVGLCFRKTIVFGIVGNKSYLCDRKGASELPEVGGKIETTCVEQMRNSSIYYSSEIIGLM